MILYDVVSAEKSKSSTSRLKSVISSVLRPTLPPM